MFLLSNVPKTDMSVSKSLRGVAQIRPSSIAGRPVTKSTVMTGNGVLVVSIGPDSPSGGHLFVAFSRHSGYCGIYRVIWYAVRAKDRLLNSCAIRFGPKWCLRSCAISGFSALPSPVDLCDVNIVTGPR